MTNEQAEFASAAELLAPAEGIKEVFLKTLNKKVKIKKVNIGELADIMKASKDNDIAQFIFLCFKGLVEPKLTLEQCRELPLKVIIECSAAIAKFSELDKESVDKIRNLLGTEF